MQHARGGGAGLADRPARQNARPGITAPIASASTVAQWQQLAQAARLSLSAAQTAALDAASAWT